MKREINEQVKCLDMKNLFKKIKDYLSEIFKNGI